MSEDLPGPSGTQVTMAREATAGWLSKNATNFIPGALTSPNTAKPLVELSLVTHRATRQGDDRLEFASPMIESFFSHPSTASAIRRFPSYYMTLAQGYLWLRMTGHRSARFESAARDARRGAEATLASRARLLELAYIDGGGEPLTDPRLITGTILMSSANPIHLTLPECYILTHEIFYLTDFGARPLSGLAPSELERIEDLLLVLMMCSSRAGNWDLTAELLVCILTLPYVSNPRAVEMCATALFTALVSPNILMDSFISGGIEPHPESPVKDEFSRQYHAVLLGYLAILSWETCRRTS